MHYFLFALALFFSLPALACEDHAAMQPVNMAAEPAISVEKTWARPTAKGAKAAAIYLSLKNNGDQPLQLTGVSTPVAGKAEIHETTVTGDVAAMRPVESITVPPRAGFSFSPGATHIMLNDLKQPLKAGTSFPLTLTFDSGEEMQVTVKVQSGKAETPDHHAH